MLPSGAKKGVICSIGSRLVSCSRSKSDLRSKLTQPLSHKPTKTQYRQGCPICSLGRRQGPKHRTTQKIHSYVRGAATATTPPNKKPPTKTEQRKMKSSFPSVHGRRRAVGSSPICGRGCHHPLSRLPGGTAPYVDSLLIVPQRTKHIESRQAKTFCAVFPAPLAACFLYRGCFSTRSGLTP